jgi:ectoine hydroxylase-related dioxygenase (phytanoyl-CoA dioxygenase family)
MMDGLTKDITSFFDENGYFVWESFIPKEHAEALRELVLDMAAYEERVGDAYHYPFDKEGKTQRIWNLTNKSEEFRRLLDMSELTAMMNHIFDRPTHYHLFNLSSYQACLLKPGAKRQKLHLDTPFPEPIPPWAAKANSIWMLDDFTTNNGSTEVVPGTHNNGRKPTAEDDQKTEYVQATGSKGSVLFTHGNVWHRAGANNSDRVRVALFASFAASFIREIASEEDHSIVICDRVKNSVSEHIKKLIGVGHGIRGGAFIDHESR